MLSPSIRQWWPHSRGSPLSRRDRRDGSAPARPPSPGLGRAVLRIGDPLDRRDVGSGDESARLAGGDEQSPRLSPLAARLQIVQDRGQLFHDRGRQFVDLLAGKIESEMDDSADLEADVETGPPSPGHQQAPSRSTTIAAPCPPPMQSVARPSATPRRRISFSSVSTSLAPEAPTGCPSAMAPPLTFVR